MGRGGDGGRERELVCACLNEKSHHTRAHVHNIIIITVLHVQVNCVSVHND